VKILVVDDDPAMREALAVGFELQWQDATVLAAADGEAGLKLFYDENPDVVVLDVVMPGRSGLDVLREIRRVSDVPVILLTARGEEIDQVKGLEVGADEYLVKPIGHLALLAHVRAVLRRARAPLPVNTAPDFAAGELSVHFANHRVTRAGEPVKLTSYEYKVLYHLVRNAGRLVTRDALLDRVWGEDYGATADYLKVFVSRVRRKLERPGGPRYIETERGIGYRFVVPREAARTT
jgi:DNA-binding response OmpR family regulator